MPANEEGAASPKRSPGRPRLGTYRINVTIDPATVAAARALSKSKKNLSEGLRVAVGLATAKVRR